MCAPAAKMADLNRLIENGRKRWKDAEQGVEELRVRVRVRWRYNTGRIDTLIKKLLEAEFAIQLRFVDELSARDSVRLLTPDGKEIAYHPDLQNFRNALALRENTDNLVMAARKAYGKV
ncbi:hypothetical protein GUITHDRAFT_132153 [Guillardia theta CCMP2712]|uniref:Uncharacterized protein n=1 Tax=Guillardia theta (strain CCMP2712) TaxID=905079 RepID=L1K1E2_GUITC|nr:hypothetical protein GUITHDRAFT_132153 [Guillardia theta CCMP2712]EKX54417.1 hypothetical protein GUITHDRAFT_132153 [Guillardia theta CCMP2712]|eukprot:XP_005841397.1 hypothetical protein GUITHDRAFT_132153 [Guillardia theta CCMP2712]